MARTFKVKKVSSAVEIRTFDGEKGRYLVMTAGDGKFHVFVEVEAKEAAKDCGCETRGHTSAMWKELWRKGQGQA